MAEQVTKQGLQSSGTGPAVGVPSPHRYREAFDRVLQPSQALEEDALLPINVDVPSVIATTSGKLAGILALHERAKALPEFDAGVFEQLETHVLATGHAHTKLMIASAPPEEILALNERGMKLRQMLYADAVALATRGLINGDRLAGFQDKIGYKNLAFDLMALAGVLRDNWEKVSGKTAVTTDDLDQADLIGDQLVNAVGARSQETSIVDEASTQRQRNFTLFANAYDEVRRAITFLRWKEDDVDEIAPSLYSGRGNSNARKKEPPVPVTPPVTNPVPVTPVADPHSTVATDPHTASAAAGLPGASPFVK